MPLQGVPVVVQQDNPSARKVSALGELGWLLQPARRAFGESRQSCKHFRGRKGEMPLLDYPGPLRVERLCDGRRMLLRPLRYEVDGLTITVPTGFKTDFSSDPISLLDWSKVDVAGVVHDFLYQNPWIVKSRRRQDRIWRKIARSGKWRAGPLSAWVGYLGIRLFGWLFRKREKKGSHEVRYKAGISSLVLAAFGAIYAIVRFFSSDIPGSIGIAICVILVLAGLRGLASWRRSSQRSKMQLDPHNDMVVRH